MNEKANIIDFKFGMYKEDSESFNIMIILNRPIKKQQYLLLRNNSDYVICADGAANRLFDLGERNK